MLQLKDLVCANVEIDGKKVAKTAPFTKTYFGYGKSDEVVERDKQFNKAVIGKVSVPKENESKEDVETLWTDMLGFFSKTVDGQEIINKAEILGLVTAAYDIQQRAPVAVALQPKTLDEDKVFRTTAANFAQMGGILDPTTGEKVTEVADIILVLKAMSGK